MPPTPTPPTHPPKDAEKQRHEYEAKRKEGEPEWQQPKLVGGLVGTGDGDGLGAWNGRREAQAAGQVGRDVGWAVGRFVLADQATNLRAGAIPYLVHLFVCIRYTCFAA